MSYELQKERAEVIKMFNDLAIFLENTVIDSQSLEGPNVKTLVGNIVKTIRFLDQQSSIFTNRRNKREEEMKIENMHISSEFKEVAEETHDQYTKDEEVPVKSVKPKKKLENWDKNLEE